MKGKCRSAITKLAKTRIDTAKQIHISEDERLIAFFKKNSTNKKQNGPYRR